MFYEERRYEESIAPRIPNVEFKTCKYCECLLNQKHHPACLQDITEEICPDCGELLVIDMNEDYVVEKKYCRNKNCNYEEEIK